MLIGDVLSHKSQALKDVITQQRTVFMRFLWTEEMINGCCTGGYITRISQASLDYYLDLLQHLSLVSMKSNWSIAKTEIDHYVKKFTMIRNSAHSRLVATVCAASMWSCVMAWKHLGNPPKLRLTRLIISTRK